MSEQYTISKLNEPKVIQGTVIHGDQSGRSMGFPTANLDVELTIDELDLGVYLGTCKITNEKKEYHCLPYFGPRLVFAEKKNQFEVFIYDFDESVYGKELVTTCTHFLRPPLPFTSLEDLQQQLKTDKREGQKLITAIMNS